MPSYMEILLIATGFTGAFTLRWLLGLVVRGSSCVEPHFVNPTVCSEKVVQEIGRARREVLLLACGFSNRAVAQALIDARLRNVAVEVILDEGNECDPTSEMHYLVEQGLPPMLGDDQPILQTAVIVDGQTIATGNFNFSAGGDEGVLQNLILIRGDSNALRAFRQRFESLKERARVVPAKTAAIPVTLPMPAPTSSPMPMPMAVSTPMGSDAEMSAASSEAIPVVSMQPVAAMAAAPTEVSRTAGSEEGPMVTTAAAELFARLRKELAESNDEEAATRPRKKAG